MQFDERMNEIFVIKKLSSSYIIFRFTIEMMHSRNGHEVDFNYFIQSTIQQKISWKSLTFLLIDLAPSLEKLKEVIEILVQELELWVSKVEKSQNQALKVMNDDIHVKRIVENSDKSNSEDESIVSEAESAYDFQSNDSKFEEKLSNSDEYTILLSEKNLESDKNDHTRASVKESKGYPPPRKIFD